MQLFANVLLFNLSRTIYAERNQSSLLDTNQRNWGSGANPLQLDFSANLIDSESMDRKKEIPFHSIQEQRKGHSALMVFHVGHFSHHSRAIGEGAEEER